MWSAPLRGSTVVALLAGGLLAILAACFVQAGMMQSAAGHRWQEGAALVAALGLSDLALFNDARYTRHPSMADLHAPFQDGPASLEHFPTGSLRLPGLNYPAGRIAAGEGDAP